MKQYMLVVDLPTIYSKEFVELVPVQRKQFQDLLSEGKIINYSLSLDRSKLWITFLSENEAEVNKLIETFPMKKYMQLRLYELAFQEQSSMVYHMSLN